MTLKNQTPFTYDCLLEFNNQHQKAAKRLIRIIYILLGVLCLISLSALLILVAVAGAEALDGKLVILLFALVLVDSFQLLVAPVLTKRSIRKQAARNSVVSYTFTPEGFEESTVSDVNSSQSQNQYSIILKVTESEHYFYLYIHPNAAHIVAKDGFSEGCEQDLRDLLRTVIEAKKLHIK